MGMLLRGHDRWFLPVMPENWPDFGWLAWCLLISRVSSGSCMPCHCWFLLKDAPRSAAELAAPVAKPSIGTAISELFTNSSFILLVLYFTPASFGCLGWCAIGCLPFCKRSSTSVRVKRVVSAALYWQGAALVSAIFGGWLADRWMQKTPRGRIYVSAIGMLCIIPALFGVGNGTRVRVPLRWLWPPLVFVRGWLGVL